MGNPIQLSVVIPAYGRADQLKNALDGLACQTHEPEIIIIDDHSPTPLLDVCKKFDTLNLRYIRMASNQGPAACRNVGVNMSSYNTIAFTDSDCIPDLGWAQALHNYLRDAPDYVAGVGGRIISLGNDLYSKYMVYHQILEPYPRSFPHTGQYLYLPTANCALRKKVINEFGGFDPEVKFPGGEDVGLCVRMVDKGYQLHFLETAVVSHDFRMNFIGFIKTFYRYGFGTEHQLHKWLAERNGPQQ